LKRRLVGVRGEKRKKVELCCCLRGEIHSSVKSVGVPPFLAHCLGDNARVQS
jgi:hypothetical protein